MALNHFDIEFSDRINNLHLALIYVYQSHHSMPLLKSILVLSEGIVCFIIEKISFEHLEESLIDALLVKYTTISRSNLNCIFSNL